jgi:putative transposase
MFFTRLLDKAEEAGRDVVRVNPAYTSQTCSACGHRQPMPLSVRAYECPHCGLVIHRDHNGSKNILAEAFQAVGRHSRVIPEAHASKFLGEKNAGPASYAGQSLLSPEKTSSPRILI